MNAAEQIRVVVADGHALVRAGLRALIQSAHDIIVVAECALLADGMTLAAQCDARVLVVDATSAGADGVHAAGEVGAARLQARLLLLTSLDSPSALEALLMAGAHGYLTALSSARDLRDAIRTVAAGGIYRTPPASVTRSPETIDDPERRRFEKLTEREREVLVCTAHGYTAPEIGARLHISAKTVDTYKQRIHEKLGLQHRTDYVQLALRLHLLETH